MPPFLSSSKRRQPGRTSTSFCWRFKGRPRSRRFTTRSTKGRCWGQPRPAQFTPHMTVGRTGEVVLAVAAAQAMKLATRGLVRAMSIYRVEPKGRREIEVYLPLVD